MIFTCSSCKKQTHDIEHKALSLLGNQCLMCQLSIWNHFHRYQNSGQFLISLPLNFFTRHVKYLHDLRNEIESLKMLNWLPLKLLLWCLFKHCRFPNTIPFIKFSTFPQRTEKSPVFYFIRFLNFWQANVNILCWRKSCRQIIVVNSWYTVNLWVAFYRYPSTNIRFGITYS